MKLSAKTEYACLAMLQLAQEHASGEPVQIRRIAEEHGIPSRFLVQILLQLKGASLVVSTRGASGGYRLSRSPYEITIADVIEAAGISRGTFYLYFDSKDAVFLELMEQFIQQIMAVVEVVDPEGPEPTQRIVENVRRAFSRVW